MGLTTQADHENCNTTIATLKDQVQQEQDTTASTILENNQQKENVNNLKKEIVVYDDKVNVLTEQIEALENEIKEATTISNYNVQVREMQLEEFRILQNVCAFHISKFSKLFFQLEHVQCPWQISHEQLVRIAHILPLRAILTLRALECNGDVP